VAPACMYLRAWRLPPIMLPGCALIRLRFASQRITSAAGVVSVGTRGGIAAFTPEVSHCSRSVTRDSSTTAACPPRTARLAYSGAVGTGTLVRWEAGGACRALAAQLRCFAISRPQELHRHRKRLEGIGKDDPHGEAKTLSAREDLQRDDDWYARKTAVDAIGRVANQGDEVQLSLLYKHAEDEDIFVREASVDSIAEIARPGDDVAVSKLAMRLADEDCFVRARAVVALGRVGKQGDVETLGLLDEMFDDGFVPVRKKSIEAVLKLAQPGDQAVLARLKRCLDDQDRGVREEAKKALTSFSSQQGQ